MFFYKNGFRTKQQIKVDTDKNWSRLINETFLTERTERTPHKTIFHFFSSLNTKGEQCWCCVERVVDVSRSTVATQNVKNLFSHTNEELVSRNITTVASQSMLHKWFTPNIKRYNVDSGHAHKRHTFSLFLAERRTEEESHKHKPPLWTLRCSKIKQARLLG